MKSLILTSIFFALIGCQVAQQPANKIEQVFPDNNSTNIVYNNDDVDNPAQWLVKIEPRYPLSALRENIEGYVVLEFVLNTTGVPTEIRVVEAQPKGVFDKEAKLVLSKSRFTSARKNGKPVTVLMQETMVFKVNEYQ